MTPSLYPSLASLLIWSALLLSACGDPAPSATDKALAARVAGAPPDAADDLATKNAAASNLAESSELIEFSYSYPREAARIAGLAAWLDNDRATVRDALIQAAKRDRAAANKAGFPYHARSHLQSWKRITNTPRFLSLSAEIATYGGGAHGMQSFDTLIWDRAGAHLLRPMDLFASAQVFDSAAKDALCAGLKQAKSRKGIVWMREAGSPFADCPVPSAQTVWLGSSDGKHLDRISIAIAPYEVGPWAEGSYRINLPMSRALVDAVKPEYARDFLPTS